MFYDYIHQKTAGRCINVGRKGQVSSIGGLGTRPNILNSKKRWEFLLKRISDSIKVNKLFASSLCTVKFKILFFCNLTIYPLFFKEDRVKKMACSLLHWPPKANMNRCVTTKNLSHLKKNCLTACIQKSKRPLHQDTHLGVFLWSYLQCKSISFKKIVSLSPQEYFNKNLPQLVS